MKSQIKILFYNETYNFQIHYPDRIMIKTVLLPGGLGYIGSHTIVELL